MLLNDWEERGRRGEERGGKKGGKEINVKERREKRKRRGCE